MSGAARAPRERAARTWLAHALLVALVLAAVGHLNTRWHAQADSSSATVTRIATVRGLLGNERDLQWRALSAGERSLEVAERLGRARGEEEELFEQLRRGELREPERLWAAVDLYHEALDAELARITLHRVDQAHQLERERTSPAHADLDRLLTRESEHAAAAARSGHRAADRMLAVALGLVVLLVGALLQRAAAAHHQSQRAAEALLAQQRAVSEALEREQEVVRHQARHDPLTGMANRLAFTEAVHELRRDDRPVAVVLIDLDGFKDVNDRFGHATGDEVLRAVAARLLGAVRPGDLAARLGGDEFAVLAPVPDARTGAELARRIGAALEEPPVSVEVPAALGRAGVGASVGHVVGPGRELEELAHRADVEMYAAKAARRAARASAVPAPAPAGEPRAQADAS